MQSIKAAHLEQDAIGDAVDAAPPGPAHFFEEPERAIDVAAAHAGIQNSIHDDGVERPTTTHTSPRRLHLVHDLPHHTPASALAKKLNSPTEEE